MANAAGQLLVALREEDPRAVEELLHLGADPSLVLEDGVAAVHLAARARRPRALHCLRILLRRGADPNARSTEALTPVHVAAVWGCHGALELLLSRGGDPTLRDQDGLRPLDWALQQGHHDCARLLRELDTPTRTPKETLEPAEKLPVALAGLESTMGRGRVFVRSPGIFIPPCLSPVSEQLMHRAELAAAREVAVEPGSPEATGSEDCSSDASFVTASEDSLQPQRPAGTLGPAASLWQSGGAEAAGHGVLSCQLQALTLTTGATNVPSLPGDGDSGALHPHGSVPPMSDLQLLQALRALGHSPGPVTPFTRGHYLRRLQEAQASPAVPGHSPELAEVLRTGHVPDCQADEAALAQHFQGPDPTKRWQGGVTKSSFTYLLLDPRQTQGLPARASSLTLSECLQCFVGAIFYVGKGTRARPDAHLWEALGYRERPGKNACPKVRRILDIWASGRGVLSLHCFQHTVAMEAYTREACLLDALGIQTLTNQKQGHYYGEAAYWPPTKWRRLGVYLLHRALLVFLAEGEGELRPQDIQARG
ncbi:ankyrin repeat and LEM domain-containing protein 1-like [Chionomys nivalis]|uniref:ankyrin repeat and LEM domain-containing protein 1-like n=1 Tax=Chionomys nivalis TaxID=269649 RepID=UPI0025999BE6|nr:ankyrin repeat and LEM domain-containing protein 1-like [Chionomys nivalis]